MCNGKDGTILTCYSNYEKHCGSQVHQSWLLQRDNKMMPTFQLVKNHYNETLKKKDEIIKKKDEIIKNKEMNESKM